ncbi:MAG: hypothetical protein JWP31_2069 [Aeromicrobium sp.]|nr:hypothetical protein [Aeromicrobium sp.]
MRIDTAINSGADPRAAAQRAEQLGFDGIWTGEVKHDPFVAMALAASVTTDVSVGTSIALALARNPMSTATLANDLQDVSGGRFALGLGAQVKAHITRRFDMPWSAPVPRMRDYVAALRAIWSAWHDETALDFTGDFYRHTLMPPMFRPEQHGHGAPPVLLAGVGPAMTSLAGEVADGFLAHGFTTATYLRDETLPALAKGRGGDLNGFEVLGGPFIVVGTTEDELAVADRAVRDQVAFYGSTPAYRGVLEAHGWGELGDELHMLSTTNRWSEMGGLITDEVMAEFAVTGSPGDVGRDIIRRYDGLLTRVSLSTSYPCAPEVLAEVVAGARSEMALRPATTQR